MQNPPVHQFLTFSILEDDVVRVRFAQCNNCGIIHKVFDLCKSEIVSGREHMNSIVSIDEIRVSLPQHLVEILDNNHADLSTFEAVKFSYDNKRWGDAIIISSEEELGLIQGKYVQIIGENLFRIESFTREDLIS